MGQHYRIFGLRVTRRNCRPTDPSPQIISYGVFGGRITSSRSRAGTPSAAMAAITANRSLLGLCWLDLNFPTTRVTVISNDTIRLNIGSMYSTGASITLHGASRDAIWRSIASLTWE